MQAHAGFAGCHSRVPMVAPVGCDERVVSLLACLGCHLLSRSVGRDHASCGLDTKAGKAHAH